MRYFVDTEFIEGDSTIDLISIAIVCEDGREYYAISTEFDQSKASEWIKVNVLPYLLPEGIARKKRSVIRDEIAEFVYADSRPEFWGYYCQYDWVALCWLFGNMMQLPAHFPRHCNDIKQLKNQLGAVSLPIQEKGQHCALNDARWNMEAYNFLIKKKEKENG